MGHRPETRGTAASRWAVAVAGAAFGVATLASGGRVLLDVPGAREAAGAYLAPVVWFNVAAGFAYLAAAAALALRRGWSARLGAAIALATVLVSVAFAAHVAGGGAFERRTVVALAFRALFWMVFAGVAARLLSAVPARQPWPPPAPPRPQR